MFAARLICSSIGAFGVAAGAFCQSSVQLTTFAVVVFGGVGTALASPNYSFTTIDVPGASATLANGINSSGQIVGNFTDATGGHGFLATPPVPPSPFVQISVGSARTPVSIDGKGEIAGFYGDA